MNKLKQHQMNKKTAPVIADPVRYSDAELNDFKVLILKKLEKAKKDLAFTREIDVNDNGTDGTSPTYKCQEEGYTTLVKQRKAAEEYRLDKFIKRLEAGLVRIENKTYGVCRETGKLIPKERLKSVPHATLSIEAKEEASLNGKKITINGNGNGDGISR